MKKLQKTPAVQAATMVLCLLFIGNADAEIHTITATGEYRMGDNDTRTDAKRLALLDAKRLALEQAGTYIESITEVKNLGVTKDEIRSYTAGNVEVTEQATRSALEGERVDVTVKIDTAVVTRQIGELRNNELAREELTCAKAAASGDSGLLWNPEFEFVGTPLYRKSRSQSRSDLFSVISRFNGDSINLGNEVTGLESHPLCRTAAEHDPNPEATLGRDEVSPKT